MTTPCSTPPRPASTWRWASCRSEGIDAVGEVGDPDPYAATMDAVREYEPDEIIISTYPESRSGWLRRDLIERIRQATGLPVEHVVADIDTEGLPFHVTLAVANRTASGDELLDALKAKAAAEGDKHEPCSSSSSPRRAVTATPRRRARTRLSLVLGRLRDAGLTAAGMIGDPDPYTAIMNALQYFRVDDIVISTFAGDQVRLAARRPDRARAQRQRQGSRARRPTGAPATTA